MTPDDGERRADEPLTEWLGPGVREPPSRVVSLCPSTTETLFELGVEDALVAVTRYCVRPSRALERVPEIGGTKDPSAWQITELEPDLILANREENRPESLRELAASYPVQVTDPRSPRDAARLVRDWGGLLGAEERAGEIAAEIEDGVERLLDADDQPVRCLYLVWRRPWMAAGSGCYIDALLRLAGGVNVVGSRGYPEISVEEIRGFRPELIVLPSEPFPFREPHADELRDAGIDCTIRLASGEDLCWHGARTRNGLVEVRRLFESLSWS